MSDRGGRVPPLFWINDAGSGLPMSVAVSGRKSICFFSLEVLALRYVERRLGGKPGAHWYAMGTDSPEGLRKIAEGAPREGFGGWVLDSPPGVGVDLRVSSWSELRDEVERKQGTGAAWASWPGPSPPTDVTDETEREDPDPMMRDGWREIPSDPETVALLRLSTPAVDILEGPSPPFEKPDFVEEFERNRRRLEFSGKEGAETLDGWRAQTEERIAALLARRPWSLLHVLGF